MSRFNGRLAKLEQLNGHGKPADSQAEVKKRIASRQEQLEVWAAMVAWFSGDNSPRIGQRLVWEPACTLGPLLPQPPPHRRGVDDPTASQCLSEHWNSRIRLSLAWIIQDWLEEGLSAEELKKPRYLKVALEEAGRMVTLEQWGPVVVQHHEYYKQNPASEVREHLTINCIDHRLHIRLYADGRIGKQFNNEAIPPEPGSRTPHYYRGPLETYISQDELSKILEQCM